MNVISVVTDAFLSDMFCNHWDELPYSVLKHLAKVIDYRYVPDRIITNNEEVRRVIRWNKLDKMQLLRILIRCIDQDVDDLEQIKTNIKKYGYRVNDLRFLFMRKPEFIEFFPIDLDKVNVIEAAMLLSLGSDYFLQKMNLRKYNFNFMESMNIIQGYKYRREVIEQVNYKSLKGHQVAEILIHTGERDIDILNLESLNSIDWINLLSDRPELIKHCNFNTFKKGDIFYPIRLCCMFDDIDLSHLVLTRDMRDITSLGWEMLLIKKPEIFLAHCNFDKLTETSWNFILKSRPELVIYKGGSI